LALYVYFTLLTTKIAKSHSHYQIKKTTCKQDELNLRTLVRKIEKLLLLSKNNLLNQLSISSLLNKSERDKLWENTE
jgi:hypothetical protein